MGFSLGAYCPVGIVYWSLKNEHNLFGKLVLEFSLGIKFYEVGIMLVSGFSVVNCFGSEVLGFVFGIELCIFVAGTL